jgi:mediator of RNA polymerase II transcription subunit 1
MQCINKLMFQSCPDIVESLKRTDFVEFTDHLEGLVSIYQLNADKKIKSKAFIALQALETDLASMASTYSHITDGDTVVMKSLLGLLQPRKGGHPVKLTYYVSPYEFLDVSSKSTLPNDVKTIVSKKIGCVATVNIQAATSYKLQMSTTVNIMRTPDGKR